MSRQGLIFNGDEDEKIWWRLKIFQEIRFDEKREEIENDRLSDLRLYDRFKSIG